MPHKRNPVAAATALAASIMAPNLAATIFAAQVQEHERSAGPLHAEWPTLPTLMLVTSGVLKKGPGQGKEARGSDRVLR
jgi:3-carboxy-cis,cis-muconate cycloisomerase